jgi:aminopeptidase N
MTNETENEGSLAGAAGSAPSAGAIAKLARKVAHHARAHSIADLALKEAMEERYGEHDEMPDTLVESINYGNGRPPTGAEIDEQMAKAGFPPLQNTQFRDAGDKSPALRTDDKPHSL